MKRIATNNRPEIRSKEKHAGSSGKSGYALRPEKGRPYLHAVAGLFFFLLLAACSTTKNLPEGEVLYTGIQDIDVAEEDHTRAGQQALTEVEAALAYPPNNALLGSSKIRFPLPFGLWIYNGFQKYKHGVGKWIFDKLAAKPVLISTVNPDLRTKVASNLLREYGYFRGSATYQVEYNQKNPRKAKIEYFLDMAQPYTYDSITWPPVDMPADRIIREAIPESLLKVGDNFNVTVLDAERQRLTSLLRNRGYFYFRPEFIRYLADTVQIPGKVNLRVQPKENLPPSVTHPWYVGDISVYLTGSAGQLPTDSLRYKDLTIHYSHPLNIRPKVLYNRFKFNEGDLYQADRQERTQRSLAQLGIFRYAEMQYTPKDTTAACDTLDLQVNAAFDLPLNGELEVNVTSKSNDQLGPGAVFTLTKKNMFKGGEIFSVRLRGSYEWQTGKRVEGSSSVINSYEFGISSSLNIPRIVFPGFSKKEYEFPATTTFRLYADQLNRAKYFKMLAFGGSATYDFKPTATSTHSIVPFKLTFNLLQHRTARFDSITTKNPALYQSLKDQFIPAMSYTYTYDNASVTSVRNPVWWQTSVTSAGNILSAIYAAAGQKFSKKEKKLLGNPFAQFMKLTSEVRYYYELPKKQTLAMRLMGGVIYSYGNATVAPYNEQFYIGGANSIRAFTVRSIGPGTFHPDEDNTYAYMDEIGDLKFEANIEYRFHILGDLYGATFLDAGNVWLLRNDPNRPGGQFSLDDLGKAIALGTGVGLRYDLTFLVIRLDLGIPIHAPYDTGKKGYYNIPKLGKNLAWHLAIGYPF